MKEKLLYILAHPFRLPILLLIRLPYFKFIRQTTDYQCPNTFKNWFIQKVINIGGNKRAYWPVHPTSRIVNPKNVLIGVDTCPGIMGNCYIQAIGIIHIGDYTQIASNVSIISANHDLYDTRIHIPEAVKIGKYCWLGVGVVVLPGVILGDFTIVGAGAVVTRSFPEGYCIIAGNPARRIKELDKSKCLPYQNKHAYIGFISLKKFKANPEKYYNPQ